MGTRNPANGLAGLNGGKRIGTIFPGSGSGWHPVFLVLERWGGV